MQASDVAIVTGAGQGIGAEIARTLAARGHAVALLDHRLDAVEEAAQRIAASGGRCAAFRADVGDPAEVDVAVGAVAATLGPVSVLVNNAALFTTLNRKPFETIPGDEWDAVMRVNVAGPFNLSKAVVPGMKARGRGRIVHMSSNTVQLGRPGFLHYVTSKAAVVGMTRAMARELGPHGITENAIMPTLTRTEVTSRTIPQAVFDDMAHLQAIPRAGEPRDVADAIAFLVSDQAGFITGQTIAVDGGAAFL